MKTVAWRGAKNFGEVHGSRDGVMTLCSRIVPTGRLHSVDWSESRTALTCRNCLVVLELERTKHELKLEV